MKMVKMFVFGFALICSSISQGANNPFWMFESRSAMDLYKIQQIRFASVTLWSGASVDEINTKADAWAYNQTKDTLNVIEILREQSLTLSVARPERDYVGCSAWLYDKNHKRLFSGGSMDLSRKEGEVWFLPEGLMTVGMSSYSTCYVTVSNAVSAKVILRDEVGNIVDIKYLDIEDNVVAVDYYDIGRNADLAITIYNGEGRYYTSLVSLRGDTETPIQELVGNNPNLFIHGLWDYGDRLDYIDYLTVTPESNDGYGQSPVLRMKVSSERSFYLFTRTTEGEEPVKVTLTDALTGDMVEYEPVGEGSKYVFINTPHAGIWYITYSWLSFDNELYWSND
jgi:hypothetical protein